MPEVRWTANARGEYWVDVTLGGRALKVLIDTGLIDARGQIGFSVQQSLYDQIKQAGGFTARQMHSWLTAAGQISLTESGLLTTSLSRRTPAARSDRLCMLTCSAERRVSRIVSAWHSSTCCGAAK